MLPTHHPGTKCPQYMEPWEYEQMQQWGKQVTKVLRHTNRKDKLGDGVTMDPEKLAMIMSSRLGFKLNTRDIWTIVQEGQTDDKSRMMVCLATHHDGKIIGWSDKLGPEPPQDECTEFSYRTMYAPDNVCINMRVVGFKCIQGTSPTGDDLQLWQHFLTWVELGG